MRASLREIAPLSALKIGAVLSACVFAAWMVAAALIYIFLGLGGVWDRMNNLLADLIGADRISAGLYFGVAAGVGLLEFVVVTLFAPVTALLYNAATGLVGGLRVTIEPESVNEPQDVENVA
ncbi:MULTISPECIES: DUF3566 domain-containing protein [unclassified Corynebacterium]|uniref:DUF3566 domain-containing protein n=1 Tax=unclassified Corynebacterium TaxID=2624378 RepID=UPI002655527A|nr:DUF3566 domain-containing protein [Janibacter sp.]MDN6258742.1 DUF3566 domain-containing protein [Corynebacterium sp.]MDN6510165.1 DUF3566 domain-containing protein [Corynebacterium sp.]